MSTILVLRVRCPQARNATMDTFLRVTHTDLCCLSLLKTKQPIRRPPISSHSFIVSSYYKVIIERPKFPAAFRLSWINREGWEGKHWLLPGQNCFILSRKPPITHILHTHTHKTNYKRFYIFYIHIKHKIQI